MRALLLLLLLACACAGTRDGADEAPEEATTESQRAGGNSGSEGAAPPPPPGGPGASPVPCPCRAGGTYFRATLLSQRDADDHDGVVVSLRVEEEIHGDSPLGVGDLIEASWDGSLPCSASETAIDDGEEVLVAFAPAQVAQSECEEQAPDGYCCSEEEWCFGRASARFGDSLWLEACEYACEEDGTYICRETSWTTGEVRLTVWEDALLFAASEEAQLRVPARDISALWADGPACAERYGNWSDLPGVVWSTAMLSGETPLPSADCTAGDDGAPCTTLLSVLYAECSAEAAGEQPPDPRCATVCARIEDVCGDADGSCLEECVHRQAVAASCEEPGPFTELLDCCADADFAQGCTAGFDACRVEACGHLDYADLDEEVCLP